MVIPAPPGTDRRRRRYRRRAAEPRAKLRTYVKTWESLSQIVNFGDTTLYKRAILATYLMGNKLHVEGRAMVDIGGVHVIGVATSPAEIKVYLGLADGQGVLNAPTFTGASAGDGTATTAASTKPSTSPTTF